MVITVKMVQQNIAEYLTYPAFLSQRSDNEGYVFPKIGSLVPGRPLIPRIQDSKRWIKSKIRICANSMHSRRKIQKYYPDVNITMVQKLYG